LTKTLYHCSAIHKEKTRRCICEGGWGFDEEKGEAVHHRALSDILGVCAGRYMIFFNRIKNILKKANGYRKV